MHEVLVNYLEVNFPEIAEQLAHARSRDPDPQQRALAAERLRALIRRLRREASRAPALDEHAPRATASELIAGVNGELSPDERRVLDHFFDLFATSMERTERAAIRETTPEAPTAGPAVETAPAPEVVREPVAEPQPVPEQEPAAEAEAEPLIEAAPVSEPESAVEAMPEPEPEAEPQTAAAEPEPVAEPEREAAASPDTEPAEEPAAPELQPGRLVAEHVAGPLQTILLAAAQQALDLLQVDASQVYTLDDQRRFMLRAGVPTESLAIPEAAAPLNSRLLLRAMELNEVYNVEDLTAEELTPDEASWVLAGHRGFAAIPLSPPLEKPVGVLVLLRHTPWRLDRRDALRLEDLAAEVVSALRANSLAIKVAEVAVLQERLNIAREIHDGLASDLAAVVALFKYYEQRRQRDPEDAGQLLTQLQSMTEEILAGARNILQSLRPKTIRSEGLLASVLKLVDQFGRVNLIETNVSIRGEENAVPAEQKDVIFQVLREGLSNVRKHAQARNLWVVLDLSSVPWVLTVRDDGRGFDVRRVAEDPKKVGSYGLVGMRERAELMGGTLEIVSQSVDGTVITLIGPADRFE
ncbi:MAG TPA: histidine kinase [Candidatus Dormibacteraeota bacterium]|nr:histidine kinase [Candidatus Dormibacteraeota bacterium]